MVQLFLARQELSPQASARCAACVTSDPCVTRQARTGAARGARSRPGQVPTARWGAWSAPAGPTVLNEGGAHGAVEVSEPQWDTSAVRASASAPRQYPQPELRQVIQVLFGFAAQIVLRTGGSAFRNREEPS